MAAVADRAPATRVMVPQAGAGTGPRPSTHYWFRDAIIYQVHVRAFQDSNHDGIGDFRGLTSRLDYIQDLGVTAIWVQPFFPSPLRDDGYDIADYQNVNPQYGTLDDFREFLSAAHHRGLKVITELVLNHTSDQHEWFHRARQAPPGSEWRDWYVWSDTPDKYPEARVIFQDFETSNWSWDPVAGAYFWHRFYSHQPDLNFDNPAVRQAMIGVLDFWLTMGVDGVRLDAVPYLYEREGTNCENLPETHAFLRDLRSYIDDHFQDRLLLAEANQWPEDAAAYFGDGDECHMNFHFPLMPRLYMAVEREDRSPIVDILEQTPLLPASCQWAIFLRNHDELTLEMVTDEERDYMYRTYALDARARINLGIRRRLAPLMGNDRRKIELMQSLLLSLPGTPILYYGDEIGMGDNYYLGDRNGVRTPMQWSADRNAGFSRANPQGLYLPVIIDPAFHYETRNVEAQQGNPHSLLWWVRRLLELRNQHPAFGRGSFEAVNAANSKVFAYLRTTDEETLLVVANLSRHSQYVELDLSSFLGQEPIELLGQTPFPTIGSEAYRLSLGPFGFYWFQLTAAERSEARDNIPPEVVLNELTELMRGGNRKVLEKALAGYLGRQRWFAGKARTLRRIEIVDQLNLPHGEEDKNYLLFLIRVDYSEGEPDSYLLPVALDDWSSQLESHPNTDSEAVILRIRLKAEAARSQLSDSTRDPQVWKKLLDIISEKRNISGLQGRLTGISTPSVNEALRELGQKGLPTVFGGEQSNSSALFNDSFILKLFRRLSTGVNPDLEIGQRLGEMNINIVPRVAGAMTYSNDAGQTYTFGIMHEYIANVGDAWRYTLDELSRYFERIHTLPPPSLSGSVEELRAELTADVGRSLFAFDTPTPSAVAQHFIGGFLSLAELLGRRVGELHVALARAGGDSRFAPESFTRLYQRSLYQSMRSQGRGTFSLLRAHSTNLSQEGQQLEAIMGCEQSLYAVFRNLTSDLIPAKRIRCHGDLHLGQILFTGKDFVIIDFEGEPERPISERRIKASPLRDVAGVLRSFHYVGHAALKNENRAPATHDDLPTELWVQYWTIWVSAVFLHSYLSAAGHADFLPPDRADLETLLSCYLLEKALYELRYELNNRPEWAAIPLAGIRQYCELTKESTLL